MSKSTLLEMLEPELVYKDKVKLIGALELFVFASVDEKINGFSQNTVKIKSFKNVSSQAQILKLGSEGKTSRTNSPGDKKIVIYEKL